MVNNVTIKPWGKEILIEHNSKYAIKEIWMNKGSRSSLQRHNLKLESILVLSGKIELEVKKNGESSFRKYSAGEYYTLIPETIHRVEVLENCRLIEVSTPELDDVIRLEDDFNRAGEENGSYRKP